LCWFVKCQCCRTAHAEQQNAGKCKRANIPHTFKSLRAIEEALDAVILRIHLFSTAAWIDANPRERMSPAQSLFSCASQMGNE
jgi:hypothetical protein